MRNTSYLLFAGMLAVIAAIVLHLASYGSAGWLFSVGAIMLLLYRTLQSNNAKGMVEKRLYKIHFVSAVILLASGYCMIIGKDYWVVGILITAVLDLYISFRLGEK